jgi:glycosyltransferase involved in cell wall biosynthesis
MTHASPVPAVVPRVALLTGGDDPHYAHGLARGLRRAGVTLDVVGSDGLYSPEFDEDPGLRFLNLRGDQNPDAPWRIKVARLARYYVRLMAYAAKGGPEIFHILWNNKVEWFDRTLLMAWYRLWGHTVLLTAHNVNIAGRDGYDSTFNRLTLRCQYGLCAHVFVHTEPMRRELVEAFGVEPHRVSVVPYGLNEEAPRTGLTRTEARRRLGLPPDAKVALFFGQIAPYKGLHHLVESLPLIARDLPGFLLVVAGKVKKGNEDYWARIEARLSAAGQASPVRATIGHVPDEEIELYYKAADVAVLPYTDIFQSGVLSLAFGFGLPVIATDVGALAEDVIDGVTGFVCRPRDPGDLARALVEFFCSELHRDREASSERIMTRARAQNSWDQVAELSVAAYSLAASA